MSHFELLLLSWLLNSLWQVPLLCAAGWIGARLIRPVGPAAEHRIWVGALLSQVLVPALSVMPWERLHLIWPWRAQAAHIGEASVWVQMSAGSPLGTVSLSPVIVSAVAVAYLLVTVYSAVRLAWQWANLIGLERSTTTLTLDGEAALSLERCCKRLAMDPVAVVASSRIFAPVTLGIFRKRILLPGRMLNQLAQTDLDAAIAHELAHIRRGDFPKNLLYELLTIPMSYHPCLWFTRQRITETREMVCDRMAAEIAGDYEYGQSLLRLATMLLHRGRVRVPHAIGVFDTNTLERRLMRLTEKRGQIGRTRMYVFLGACLLIGIATAGSALALRVAVDSHTGADSRAQKKSIPDSVPAKEMQQHLLHKVNPTYPPEAKKARIQGKVVLDAIISKTGEVLRLRVVSGPKELQQSALDAVRQWTYEPVLFNGNPIEVRTTINVIYSLSK